LLFFLDMSSSLLQFRSSMLDFRFKCSIFLTFAAFQLVVVLWVGPTNTASHMVDNEAGNWLKHLTSNPFQLQLHHPQPHPQSKTVGQTLSISLGDEPWQRYNQTEFAFVEQRVDHFDVTNRRTFSQRYFVIDDFWASPKGPVLFILCGEYTCPGIIPSRLFPLQLAYENQALVVIAEHRYYGGSYPTGSSSEDLSLLNARQALNDFAFFQEWFQRTQISEKYNITTRNKWIAVGGSYAGALSAWYRIKYPHLVVGSLSSSGVVNAILNFTKFDQQVAASTGVTCTAALQLITKAIEKRLPDVKSDFKADVEMDDGDFMFLMADSAAEGVQYGHRKILCDSVVPTYTRYLQGQATEEDLVAVFANYTINFFYSVMGNDPSGYDRRNFFHASDTRSWWWQTCTELAYWQIFPPDNSIRSKMVSFEWYQSVCVEVFNITTLPDTEATNNYFGGENVSGGSNIFFTNGVEDPWRWAGVQLTFSPSLPSIVIDCDQCGHCVELYTPTEMDDEILKNTRKRIGQFVTALFKQNN